MFDFIKGQVCDSEAIDSLVTNPKLNFIQLVDMGTGDLLEFPKTCLYKNFKLVIKSPTFAEFTGSLHIYYTQLKNDTDFTRDQIIEAIQLFENEFGIDSRFVKLVNLEFGVNLQTVYPALNFLLNAISYKGKRPKWHYDNVPGFYFIEFGKTGYYIKIYAKRLGITNQNLLRVEIKYVRSELLNLAGIFTLHDLRNEEPFRLLGKELIDLTYKVIFDDDTILITKLPVKKRELYLLLRNPNYWSQKFKKRNRQVRYYEGVFRNLVDEFGSINYNSNLKKLVTAKLDFLLNG